MVMLSDGLFPYTGIVVLLSRIKNNAMIKFLQNQKRVV